MVTVVSSSGSSSLTSWKRRARAASFSKYFLYSLHVVAAMVRSSPRASAGFSRFAASPPPASPPAAVPPGLQRVRGAPPARLPAGADQRVRLVDEQDDGLRRGLHLLDDAL